MKDFEFTLGKILENNKDLDRGNVKDVLILYEEKILYLGDSCIKLDKLRGVRTYFYNARISLNYLNPKFTFCYSSLMANNPNLDEIHQFQWTEIAFERYDLIICLTYDEIPLLKYLNQNYGNQILTNQIKLCVISVSDYFLPTTEQVRSIFPANEDFVLFFSKYIDNQLRELYISEKERQWADLWYKMHGLNENENVHVIIDSSSKRYKLMGIDSYFDLLKILLTDKNSKILIFDEKSIGKKEFYQEWLGDELIGKIIFASGNSLREDLCLLSSKHVKMIFGPCTGLLHCASGIYNQMVNSGMPIQEVPLIITYTGKYSDEGKNAYYWWKNSPLINCLLLRLNNGSKEMVLLSDLDEFEREEVDNQLDCNLYTAELFADFIRNKGVLTS